MHLLKLSSTACILAIKLQILCRCKCSGLFIRHASMHVTYMLKDSYINLVMLQLLYVENFPFHSYSYRVAVAYVAIAYINKLLIYTYSYL